MGGSTNGKNRTWTVEGVEKELDALIERRAQEAGEANYHAQAWSESARRYDRARAAQMRAARIEFHRDQAARLRATMTALADEHEAAAAALAAEAGGGG